jgi:hypothetical protein
LSFLQAAITPENKDLLVPAKIPSLKAAASYNDKMKSKPAPSRGNNSKIEFSDEIDINHDDEFKDEFWHCRGSTSDGNSSISSVNMFGMGPSQPKAPQFLPRTKLYHRRQHAQGANSTNS